MTPTQRAEYIRRLVDQAPPLTAAQRDRLAALLQRPKTPTQEADGADRS